MSIPAVFAILSSLDLAGLGFHGANGLVDEAGRYFAGGDLNSLMPEEPSEEDRKASIDLSQLPPEKLMKLLAYQILQEDKRPAEKRLRIHDFQLLTGQEDRFCEQRYVHLATEVAQVCEIVGDYHRNITSTAGLFWLLHKFPGEKSWIWLLASSHQRIIQKTNHYFSRLSVFALDDIHDCLTASFRTVFMNAASLWRRIHGDFLALLWNGLAFGVYGDVTSWREVDEDNGTVADGPGGDAPNVTWAENLIFGNMWAASVAKFLEHHAAELQQAAHLHLTRVPSESERRELPALREKTAHGGLATFDFLRRQTYNQWDLDKGLLRSLLRHVWQPPFGNDALLTVADFGAGGGRYSEWLNETGLIRALAFDATPRVGEITGGSVAEFDLASEDGDQLGQTFNWALCLEVGQHVPGAQASIMLRNIRKLAQVGLVMSWSNDAASLKHINPLSEDDFVRLVEHGTGFRFDKANTEVIRSGSDIPQIARSVSVFRRTDHVAPQAISKRPDNMEVEGASSWWR